jgi:hypothetical protein
MSLFAHSFESEESKTSILDLIQDLNQSLLSQRLSKMYLHTLCSLRFSRSFTRLFSLDVAHHLQILIDNLEWQSIITPNSYRRLSPERRETTSNKRVKQNWVQVHTGWCRRTSEFLRPKLSTRRSWRAFRTQTCSQHASTSVLQVCSTCYSTPTLCR